VACYHYYADAAGLTGDSGFVVPPAPVAFGPGILAELGHPARAAGMRRVLLLTDARIRQLPFCEVARRALADAGCDVVIYDEVHVEPTDASFLAAARAAAEVRPDGYVSLGGGSVIDTAKAAALLTTWPDELFAYVNAPLGAGRPVPGPLAPHIACPTTSGTGSECTGIAIFDILAQRVKTGIAHRHLKPSLGLVDPETTRTLPGPVVAATAFDVLSHALESYTARPFTRRQRPADGSARPLSQGANPWSDIGCEQALRLVGAHLVRGATDPSDHAARAELMWAATLAGIAFGNAGVHVPHGMSYSVAGMVRDFMPEGWPADEPRVPHGMAVIVNAPAAFRLTAATSPARHLAAAGWLGADLRGADEADAGELLAGQLERMMRDARIPTRLTAFGYGPDDVDALARGAFAQERLLANSPRAITLEDLATLYRASL
jgi:alcohol dehydrogenase class IV